MEEPVEEDPKLVYMAMKEKLEYMIAELQDVVDYLELGLNQNLVSEPDPEWFQGLMDKGGFLGLAGQMQIETLEPEEKEQLRHILMPDDPSTERR